MDSRGLVVILDHHAWQGCVIPAMYLVQILTGEMKERLEVHLASGSKRYAILHIEGSYFGRETSRAD